jgi:hypothetical protein
MIGKKTHIPRNGRLREILMRARKKRRKSFNLLRKYPTILDILSFGKILEGNKETGTGSNTICIRNFKKKKTFFFCELVFFTG